MTREDIEIAACLYEDSCHTPSAQRHFIDGVEWLQEQYTKNRLEHCEHLTKEEYERESKFAVEFLKEHNRQPTFSDAIEWERKELIKKIIKFLNANQGNLNYIDEEGNLYSDGFIVGLIKHLEE